MAIDPKIQAAIDRADANLPDYPWRPAMKKIDRQELLKRALNGVKRHRIWRSDDEVAAIDTLARERAEQMIAGNDLQSSLDTALADISTLRNILEWLHSRGGLGLDIHAKIATALAAPHSGAALLAERDALKAEVADWRDTQRAVMSETCPTDEVHCTCVPMLKKKITEFEAERDRLRKALEDATLALESCPPALMRQSYAASASEACAALAKEHSND